MSRRTQGHPTGQLTTALAPLLQELGSEAPDPRALQHYLGQLTPQETALVMTVRDLRAEIVAALPGHEATPLDQTRAGGGILGMVATGLQMAKGTYSIEALEEMTPEERLALRLDPVRLADWAEWHGPTGFIVACQVLGVEFPVEFLHLCIDTDRLDFLAHPAIQSLSFTLTGNDACRLFADPCVTALVQSTVPWMPHETPWGQLTEPMVALCQDPVFRMWTLMGLSQAPEEYVQAQAWRLTVMRNEAPSPGEAQYESQRDNEGSNGIKGDAMCNVTSLAMVLSTLAGDPIMAKLVVVDLLLEWKVGQAPEIKASVQAEARGEHPEKIYQLEDLLLRFMFEGMKSADWKAASEKYPKLFPKPDSDTKWYPGILAKYGTNPPWHKHQACLSYVAMLCKPIVGSVTENPGRRNGVAVDSEAEWAQMAAALDAGDAVFLSTQLSKAGHIVQLVACEADGVILNDPFGFVTAKRVWARNGEISRDKRKEALDGIDDNLLKTRLRANRATRALFEGPEALDNHLEKPFPNRLGERVFYTHAESKKWDIGKWWPIGHRGKQGGFKLKNDEEESTP